MDDRSQKLLGLLLSLALAFILNACGRSVCPPVQEPYPYPSTATGPQQPREPRNSSKSPASSTFCRPQTSKDVVEKPLMKLETPRTITHEVGPLETIWRIARMYEVSEESIYAANNLKPGTAISVGQKLVIPNAKALRHVIALYPNTRWQYIIVHHTATDIGKASIIDRSHADRGFWQGLGYHFLIDNGTLGKGDGQIEVAPRWIKQQNGAHCKAGGMNEKAIGIALVGNFNEELPTASQIQSLVYLLKTLSRYYHVPGQNILGHRDVPGAATDCPGRRFPWSSLRGSL
ncbi:MAG: N-acetylmuramoyl-L-alanine amidase [Syntrophobacteraceae bacterium]|nr:N-acetylmuramoyl-L-alanine amidase [Desulfobacteraceae bacterium]